MQAAQSGIDGLFFTGHKPDVHTVFLEGKHLGSEHRRIRDAQEFKTLFPSVCLSDDEKPGSIR
ncbi:hypothetical protein ES703_71589 [subsurface metagenome]